MNPRTNPHRSAVAQEVSRAILKERARKGRPAIYWPHSEQIQRLEDVYKKWEKHGDVWSAAAEKVSIRAVSIEARFLICPCVPDTRRATRARQKGLSCEAAQ